MAANDLEKWKFGPLRLTEQLTRLQEILTVKSMTYRGEQNIRIVGQRRQFFASRHPSVIQRSHERNAESMPGHQGLGSGFTLSRTKNHLSHLP